MRGDLVILRLSDGKPLITHELGTPIFANPAVSGNRIYVCGQDGSVYCLGK
jgi:outer membrane protein assembly factor BamB